MRKWLDSMRIQSEVVEVWKLNPLNEGSACLSNSLDPNDSYVLKLLNQLRVLVRDVFLNE